MPEIEPMWWLSAIRLDKIVHAAMFGMLNYLFIFPIFKSEMVESTKVNYFIWISLLKISKISISNMYGMRYSSSNSIGKSFQQMRISL